MCVSVGEIRGRDQLAVSGSLRWFPVSERRKSRCLCVRIYIFFFLHGLHVCSYMCLEVA